MEFVSTDEVRHGARDAQLPRNVRRILRLLDTGQLCHEPVTALAAKSTSRAVTRVALEWD